MVTLSDTVKGKCLAECPVHSRHSVWGSVAVPRVATPCVCGVVWVHRELSAISPVRVDEAGGEGQDSWGGGDECQPHQGEFFLSLSAALMYSIVFAQPMNV